MDWSYNMSPGLALTPCGLTNNDSVNFEIIAYRLLIFSNPQNRRDFNKKEEHFHSHLSISCIRFYTLDVYYAGNK